MLQPVFRRLLWGRTGRVLSLASSGLHRPLFGRGKFEERLPVVSEKKRRYLVTLDERVVKANKKVYYVYSAVDVERNELILMRVYTNRNYS